jgi:hypothetical protein
MIEIHVNPAKVERVLFVAGSQLEEDFDHAAWQIIRPLVNRMDKRLRRASAAAVRASGQPGGGCQREVRR